MEHFTDFGFTAISTLWVAVHLLGLFAAWMVRKYSGQRYELFAHGGFFTALLAVALTTVVGHLCCVEMWPLSAVTLVLMIVLAVVEPNDSQSLPVNMEA